jgi:ferritin-like metal-binding protein YciE
MYDSSHAYQMEYRAYMEEINYAESIGDHESAAALRAMLEQDRIFYLGE